MTCQSMLERLEAYQHDLARGRYQSPARAQPTGGGRRSPQLEVDTATTDDSPQRLSKRIVGIRVVLGRIEARLRRDERNRERLCSDKLTDGKRMALEDSLLSSEKLMRLELVKARLQHRLADLLDQAKENRR